jgi:hypothetical protein
MNAVMRGAGQTDQYPAAAGIVPTRRSLASQGTAGEVATHKGSEIRCKLVSNLRPGPCSLILSVPGTDESSRPPGYM